LDVHLGRDEETLRRVGVFLELQVEQGRGLMDRQRPVAVGSSIWPHGRWRLELLGEANHAGTTRLADRNDPMLRLAAVIATARQAAQARGCDTRFEPVLVSRLAALLGGARVLGTGAGHDAGILASAGVTSAMLFVRNPTGISHSPDEHAERDDCLAGIAALTRVVQDLAGVTS
jgi:N-carbamoyl-L-amino-acid hydrolase